jgi:ABC-type sugar transport system substrate-binding protein
MTTCNTDRGGPRNPRFVALGAIAAAAILIAGCSSTTKSGGSTAATGPASSYPKAADVPSDQLATAIKRVIFDDVPASSLPPVVADTLAVASTPFTADQTALLKNCLTQTSCETGHGTLTVGINADFTNNPFWAVRRAEATAQAIAYPQVKKIIFTSSAAGNITQVLANLRSLIAQKVSFIVEDAIFGAAVLPAAREAKAAGIPFITENGPLPTQDESQVTTQFPYPLCSMAKAAVAAMTKSATTTNKTYELITGVPGNAFSAVWWPCAQQSFDALGWKQIGTQYTQWTQQGEAQAASALLSSGKDPGAVLYDSALDNYLLPYINAGKTPPLSFQDTSWYHFLPVVEEAQSKGVKVDTYACDGHVWYGRLGVTAGVEMAMGVKLPNKIEMPVAVVPFSSIPKITGMPANTDINPLLPPDLVNFALAHG